MSKVTIITRIRFLAGIAPLILLLVVPILAFALSRFGNLPSDLREHEIAALKYAHGLDTALYKMEWGRTQPDGPQIVLDQQRRFADLMDSEAHHVYTPEQRDKLRALAQAAKPTLDAFRHADPHDDTVNARMRDLHVMAADLMTADEAALSQVSDRASGQARQLVVLALLSGILLPFVCMAVIWRLTETMRQDVRAIRTHLERISERPAAKDASVAPDLEAIDGALTRLGFPKPNPMLAEE